MNGSYDQMNTEPRNKAALKHKPLDISQTLVDIALDTLVNHERLSSLAIQNNPAGGLLTQNNTHPLPGRVKLQNLQDLPVPRLASMLHRANYLLG